jgi:dTDP-glucose pyrophosphorylase
MIRWEDVLVTGDTPILAAISAIDGASTQMVLIVDGDRRLIGAATDGDIRRGILRGVSLDSPISTVMNPRPFSARASEDRSVLLAIMRRDRRHAVPLVDAGHRVVGLVLLDELLDLQTRDNWVVLMAGGEGRRLHPLTKDVPKPLLKVGTQPILETIMERFVEAGFKRFFLSVNYLAEQIEDYFGDGSSRGISITYLREDTKMGTAGALRLLPERPEQPFFVMNGDILTNLDFPRTLEFHAEQRVSATMCVREHLTQVPYGVVEMDGHRLLGITEKPVTRHFVNAGIYVLGAEVLDVIPQGDEIFDMPQLFQSLVAAGRTCAAMPVREYWLDVGQMADFQRANTEFTEIFR